jgi:hypothetical protein
MSNHFNIEDLLNLITETIADKVSTRINTLPANNPKDENEEAYLDTQETLEFINVKTRVTLDKYVLEGRIDKPIKRGGRKLYYKKSSLINFLQNG